MNNEKRKSTTDPATSSAIETSTKNTNNTMTTTNITSTTAAHSPQTTTTTTTSYNSGVAAPSSPSTHKKYGDMSKSSSNLNLGELNVVVEGGGGGSGNNEENAGITYKASEKGPKMINQYILGEILGEGGYGKVREAIDSRTLKRVAIKIIKRRNLKKVKNGEENLRNEINIMRRMKHTNVIKLIEVIPNEEKQKIYIVLEFAGAGSLQQVMDSLHPKKLSLSDVHYFFKQLIEGLEYIHNQGVIHRDIKPGNLMITPDRVLKISDFGVARELDSFDKDDVVTNSFGSPAFQSPQIASGKKHFSGYKLDVWACGVSLYVMVTGNIPFQGKNVFELFENIAKAEYELPEYVKEPLASLIKGMLEKDEEKRFTIQQIKEHEWFKTSVPSEDKPPLIDRWKSKISLAAFVSKVVDGDNIPKEGAPNVQRRKSSSAFLPSFKPDVYYDKNDDPLNNPRCNIL